MMSEEVPMPLTCPFDGGNPVIDVYPAINSVFVKCERCGATGPLVAVMQHAIAGDTREWIEKATAEAVKLWNERSEDEVWSESRSECIAMIDDDGTLDTKARQSEKDFLRDPQAEEIP